MVDGEVRPRAASGKKRGRKAAQKKTVLMKPEDVLNYLIRNYPRLQIDKIKDIILTRIQTKDTDRLYVLDEITIDHKLYYCDTYGNIINSDTNLCGFIVCKKENQNESIESINSIDSIDSIGHTYQKPASLHNETYRVQMFDVFDGLEYNMTTKQIIDRIEGHGPIFLS